MAEKVLTYKGYPLVRSGNIAYYGNITDKYIVMLQILSTEKKNDLDVSGKIAVQLQLTDPAAPARERIAKSTETVGFYEAMDLASIWLDRALSTKGEESGK